ncbi:ArsR family transcriptional regulator [bacterium]|nr:MAG: ArsR family transcriptional regulator [bacterium]
MSDELRRVTDVDRLIHEPARLLIVTLLYPVERVDFLYLLHETGLTKGNLSAHLSKLENADYVRIEKTYRGKVPQTLLNLTPAGRAAFEGYRAHLKQIVDRLSQE